MTNTTTTTFNGWANWETWNVALWINNDEDNYDLACASVDYDQFMNAKSFESTTTPDGAAWNDKALDYDSLNELITETTY